MTRRRILVLLLVAALGVLLVLPHPDGTLVDLTHRFAPPSRAHPLGTDDLGRDLWARMASGLTRSLTVVVVASLISAGVGLALGLLSGYRGGWAQTVVMGVTDLLMIVPTFIAALIVAALLGLTPTTAGVTLGIFGIGSYVNQTHALVRTVRTSDFVHAEVLLGTPTPSILVRQILPLVSRPLLGYFGASAASVVLSYAGLAFIGLGVDATTPDWGTMVYEYRVYLFDHPTLVVWPTLGIFVLALVLNLAVDPSSAGPSARRPHPPRRTR